MPLNLARALANAHRFAWQHRQDLFAYAFLPVVVLGLLETLAIGASGDWRTMFEPVVISSDDPEAAQAALRIGLTHLIRVVALAFAYVLFAIPWYRKQLVGDAGKKIGTLLRWSPLHWRFIGSSLVLILIMSAAMMVLSIPLKALAGANPMAGLVAQTMLLVFVGLAGARVLLIFPALAIGAPLTPRQSLELTRGRGWMLFAIAVLPLLASVMLSLIMANVIALVLVPVIGTSISLVLLTVLVIDALSFIGFAIQISALGYVYQQLAQSGTSRSS